MVEATTATHVPLPAHSLVYYQTVAALIPVLWITLFFQLRREVDAFRLSDMGWVLSTLVALAVSASLILGYFGEVDALQFLELGYKGAAPWFPIAVGLIAPGALIVGLVYGSMFEATQKHRKRTRAAIERRKSRRRG